MHNSDIYVSSGYTKAIPMTKGEYAKEQNTLYVALDWGTPNINNVYESDNTEGYMLLGKGPEWLPKYYFEKIYKKPHDMTFSQALEMLKAGFKVARKGWNGKGMYIFLVNGIHLARCVCNKNMLPYTDSICIKTADDKISVGWTASQTDMLSEDWEIIN